MTHLVNIHAINMVGPEDRDEIGTKIADDVRF